jgi:hypothetical protein
MGRRHLVYVLPGIGGSVLERPAVAGKRPETVWDAGFGDVTGLLLRPGRLAADEPLRAIGMTRSRRLLPGWTVIPGYEGLQRGLAALPGVRLDSGHPDHRDPHADVVVFPYDFRLGVAHAAKLLAADVHERLRGYSDAEKAGRVVVVAHSMGGLVARYWLGPLQGWPVCRSLITLGTPHRGAPKALHLLANGVRVAGIPLPVGALLRQWPSVAELLPRYPAVWDGATGVARYPHEIPADGLGAGAKRAFDMHQEIEQAWAEIPRTEAAPQVKPRLGWSHDTAGSAVWDGRNLTMHKTPPAWLDLAGWEADHGDGTVPAISAVPVEMSGYDTAGWRVRDRHGPLAGASWIPDMVEAYETRATLAAVHGDERQTALGLDLDDMHGEGTPMPLRVRLRGDSPPGTEPGDLAGLPVWASVRPADAPGTVTETRLDWDAGTASFTAELPGRPAGMYDVKVSARAVPGAGDLSVRDTVAVVAP